jgi:hypothetical protein
MGTVAITFKWKLIKKKKHTLFSRTSVIIFFLRFVVLAVCDFRTYQFNISISKRIYARNRFLLVRRNTGFFPLVKNRSYETQQQLDISRNAFQIFGNIISYKRRTFLIDDGLLCSFRFVMKWTKQTNLLSSWGLVCHFFIIIHFTFREVMEYAMTD